MDVYTQSNQKYFTLSEIIKLLYNSLQWKLNVRVALSAKFSKYNRYSDTSFLFTSSNVSQRWMGVTLSDVIPILVSIFFTQRVNSSWVPPPQLPGFADLPYKHHTYAIHPPALVCLNWSVSITMPEIDLRFSPNDPLNLLASSKHVGFSEVF
jgi:hypothetical protein